MNAKGVYLHLYLKALRTLSAFNPYHVL